MYKILVVDDEKIERKGVIFLFKQMDIECEIEEIVNGQAALEYLETHEVDILLTDVKMPHMDGMEFIQKIKKRNLNPNMKIIIVSGYSDFEYAKLAVKLGVSDYILKPVDPKEFEPTLRKIIDELDSQKYEQDLKEKSMSFMKQHYLYSLVNGLGANEVEELGLSKKELNVDYHRLMLFEFGHSFFGKSDNSFLQNMQECIGDIEFEYLNLNTNQCIIFFNKKESDEKYWRELAAKIQEMILNEHKTATYIAISKDFEDASDITAAYEEAENLMENRFYETESKIYISYADDEISMDEHVDDDTIMKQMKQDIKMKDTENLKVHFEKLCMKYKRKNDFSQVYIKFIFSNLLKDFYDNLPDVSALDLNSEIEKLYKSVDFQTVIDIVNINIRRLEETFQSNPQMIHREIESVKQYIYEHYGEEISVEYLADLVYMAPSYLSCVFKKETGQNLSKFIKAYRMEKAKEMLEESHKKIVTISNEVGYPNVSYFCQSFREYFGISPQKFRSQGEK